MYIALSDTIAENKVLYTQHDKKQNINLSVK